MSQTLNVAIVQSELTWENPSENRRKFSKKIENIADGVDLIVLPEMFTSGFTMHPERVSETMQGETINLLKSLAKSKNAAITGSLVISGHNQFFNRCIFIHPEGAIDVYDKRHTFTLAGEHKVYTAGTIKIIINYKNWKICPLICYDLRFPVWARNTEDYDLLIYMANWPKPRINAWDALLKARAIENMSYCIGVNRVGLDANGHEYTGHSACYDVLGHRMDSIKENVEAIEIIALDKGQIQLQREKLQFLNDRDRFNLEV